MTPEQAAAMNNAGQALMNYSNGLQQQDRTQNCTYVPNGFGGWIQTCN